LLGKLRALSVAGARYLVTVNAHAWHPPVAEVGGLPEPTPASVRAGLAAAYERAGWWVSAARYLTAEEVAALHTSWTRRLGASRPRLRVLAFAGTIGAPPAATAGQALLDGLLPAR
jgi:16S rRNA (adenine(1408)-N(1))-methyltransferase